MKGHAMANLVCPSCGQEMKELIADDIATDVCDACGSVFLDKTELNTLATGMAGDIEALSIDKDLHAEQLPRRACPKCPDQPMKKVNLLRVSDIVFDHCPLCGGFFLDKDKVRDMNLILKEMTPNRKAEEYRGMHGNHLVRVDQAEDIVQLEHVALLQVTHSRYIRISVFFTGNLPPGFRVFQESWPMRLIKAFGLFHAKDVKTGDERFDNLFRVRGENDEDVASHLDSDARDALVSFAGEKNSIYGRSGDLDITSSSVVYVEGPYPPITLSNLVEDSRSLVLELVAIADKVEAAC
jgi:Zn-finger nucleic acid-binding protein